jgi:hypothetical protein
MGHTVNTLDCLSHKSAKSHLAIHSKTSGGGRRDRTDDLMLAKHALSQLSYAPVPEDECSTLEEASRQDDVVRECCNLIDKSRECGGPGKT